jgi:FeS assembly protein IscX
VPAIIQGDCVLTDQINELYWDSTYAVATMLIERYPDHNPEEVGLNELADLVESLPGFNDDPGLVTEQILLDIQTVWYEETLDL